MIDLHTHLYWKSYDADREAVIERARAASVEKMLCVGTALEESRIALALATKHADMQATVGMHPHEFNDGGSMADGNTNFIEEFRALAKDKKVVAIGECGLDYYSHNPEKNISAFEKENQKKGFFAQIELASELKLPLIVHCRDAYEDMFKILKMHESKLEAVVLHCYMGDTEITKKFLTLNNVYFSFTGNITYPVKKHIIGTKDDLGKVVAMIPLERIFTETDCPFLAPQEKRGERNEPAYVRFVLQKIAELHGKDGKVVENMIEKNYQKVFNF